MSGYSGWGTVRAPGRGRSPAPVRLSSGRGMASVPHHAGRRAGTPGHGCPPPRPGPWERAHVARMRHHDPVPAVETVEFASQGTVLRGRLYHGPGPRPSACVVMTHGTSATIGMVTDRYAEAFHDAGLAVLLYDHHGFGASGGEPRQEINPWIQARGYRDALTHLCAHPRHRPLPHRPVGRQLQRRPRADRGRGRPAAGRGRRPGAGPGPGAAPSGSGRRAVRRPGRDARGRRRAAARRRPPPAPCRSCRPTSSAPPRC